MWHLRKIDIIKIDDMLVSASMGTVNVSSKEAQKYDEDLNLYICMNLLANSLGIILQLSEIFFFGSDTSLVNTSELNMEILLKIGDIVVRIA